MSNFDDKSLKNVTLKSRTTHKCFTSKTIKSNIYLNSSSIQNNNTSQNNISTLNGVYEPSIYNEWEDYAIKYGEEYLNSHRTRSTKQTLKRHLHKRNKIFYNKVI